jgi:putative transcriptional regulator
MYYFNEDDIVCFYQIISKNVKKYRLQQGFSQLELSLEIGIKSIAFFSNAENNKYNKHFNIEHIYKISKVLGVDFCNFFQETS